MFPLSIRNFFLFFSGKSHVQSFQFVMLSFRQLLEPEKNKRQQETQQDDGL